MKTLNYLIIAITVWCSNIAISKAGILHSKNDYNSNIIILNQDGNSFNRDFEEDLKNCYVEIKNYTINCDFTVRNKAFLHSLEKYERKIEIPIEFDEDGKKLFNNHGSEIKQINLMKSNDNKKFTNTNQLAKAYYRKLIDECDSLCELKKPYDSKYQKFVFKIRMDTTTHSVDAYYDTIKIYKD